MKLNVSLNKNVIIVCLAGKRVVCDADGKQNKVNRLWVSPSFPQK